MVYFVEEIKCYICFFVFEEDGEESVEGDEGRGDVYFFYGVEEGERFVEEVGVGVGFDEGVEEVRVEFDGVVGVFFDGEEEVVGGVEVVGLGEEVEYEEEGVGVVGEGGGGGEVVEEVEGVGRVGDEVEGLEDGGCGEGEGLE